MSSTDNVPALGDCPNVAGCGIAKAGQPIEWYRGPGEYCPECGEALTPRGAERARADSPGRTAAPVVPPPAAGPTLAAPAARTSKRWPLKAPAAKPPTTPFRPPNGSANGAKPAPELVATVPTAAPTPAEVGNNTVPLPRKTPLAKQGWLWVVIMLFVASGALGYLVSHRDSASAGGELVTICPAGSAEPLATDLVRAYALKAGAPEGRFVFAGHGRCDVRFAVTADTPDGAIATDGIVAIVNPLNPLGQISELQLREIFSGAVHDWAQLGQAPGAIVAILPNPATDEAKALTTSLFAGVQIDRGVRRAGSSSDVTRLVTGADGDGRRAIALVAFSQALAAKVVPLAYLPPPSLLSIASHRYPYTLSFTVEPATDHPTATAAGLIEYARSNSAASIVQANGLVPHAGS